MATLVNILRIVVQLFPALIELVKGIEAAVPVKGIGADKLALIQGIVQDTYDTLDAETKKTLSIDQIMGAVISIVNRLVAIFNKAGIFQK